MKNLYFLDSNSENPLRNGRFVFEDKTTKTESEKPETKEVTPKKNEDSKKELHRLGREVHTVSDTTRKLERLKRQADREREKKEKLDQMREEVRPAMEKFKELTLEKINELSKTKPELIEKLAQAMKSGNEQATQSAMEAISAEFAADPELNKAADEAKGVWDSISEKASSLWEGTKDVAGDTWDSAKNTDKYSWKRALGAGAVGWFAPNFFADVSFKSKLWWGGITGALFLHEDVAVGVMKGAEFVLDKVVWEAGIKFPIHMIGRAAMGISTGEILDNWTYMIDGKIDTQRLREKVADPEFYKDIEKQEEFWTFMPDEIKKVYDRIAKEKEYQTGERIRPETDFTTSVNRTGGMGYSAKEKLNTPHSKQEIFDVKDPVIDQAAKLFVQSMDHIDMSQMVLSEKDVENIDASAYYKKMRTNFLSIYNSGMYRFFNEHPDENVRNAFWKKIMHYAALKDQKKLESVSMDTLFKGKIDKETTKAQRTGIDRFMFNGSGGNGVQLAIWGGLLTYGLSALTMGYSYLFKDGIPKLWNKGKELFTPKNKEVTAQTVWKPESIKKEIEKGAKGDFEKIISELQEQNVITGNEKKAFLDLWKKNQKGKIDSNYQKGKRINFIKILKNSSFYGALTSKTKTISEARNLLRKSSGDCEFLDGKYFDLVKKYSDMRATLLDKKQNKKGLNYTINTIDENKKSRKFVLKKMMKKKNNKEEEGVSVSALWDSKESTLQFRKRDGVLEIGRLQKDGEKKNSKDWKWREITAIEKV